MKLRSLLLALAACSDGGPHTTPDAMPDAAPLDLTIKVFPNGTFAGGATANAALVAAQDGDGAWQPLTGSGGIYHVTIHEARYAVAVACPANAATFQGAAVNVYARTIADGGELRADGCFAQDSGRVSLTVTVPNLAANERAEVWAADDVNLALTDSPAVLSVHPGHIDMMIRKRMTGSTVTSLVYRTALDVTADKALTVDLAAVGKPPDHMPLAVANLDPAETAHVSASFAPGIGFAGIQMPLEGENLANPPRYALLPASLRLPTDISNITLTASRQTGNRSDDRYVRLAMNPPIQPTIKLPPPVAFTAPTIDATPLRRATITFPVTPATLGHLEYDASLSTSDPQGGVNASWYVSVSPGWSTDSHAITFVTPDLSALPGWSAAFALQAGPVSWDLERYEGNMPFDTPPVDGRMFVVNDTYDTIN